MLFACGEAICSLMLLPHVCAAIPPQQSASTSSDFCHCCWRYPRSPHCCCCCCWVLVLVLALMVQLGVRAALVRDLACCTTCSTCSSVSCWALICSACASIAARSSNQCFSGLPALSLLLVTQPFRFHLQQLNSPHCCRCCWGGRGAGGGAGRRPGGYSSLMTCSNQKT